MPDVDGYDDFALNREIAERAARIIVVSDYAAELMRCDPEMHIGRALGTAQMMLEIELDKADWTEAGRRVHHLNKSREKKGL
jgi:hypothetical protein